MRRRGTINQAPGATAERDLEGAKAAANQIQKVDLEAKVEVAQSQAAARRAPLVANLEVNHEASRKVNREVRAGVGAIAEAKVDLEAGAGRDRAAEKSLPPEAGQGQDQAVERNHQEADQDLDQAVERRALEVDLGPGLGPEDQTRTQAFSKTPTKAAKTSTLSKT